MSATGSNGLRVVLADDHHIFREGLRAMLTEEGMEVLGEAVDGGSLVELVGELSPDVAVLDLSMPGASGLEAVPQIAAVSPGTRIVVLTVSAAASDVLEALRGGASAYLLKDMRHDELAGAIRLAAAGNAVLAGAVMEALVESVGSAAPAAQVVAADNAGLTPRELDVIRLLTLGADNAGIGKELSISRHTVKQYVTSICKKIGVQSRVQAAVYAVRNGLV